MREWRKKHPGYYKKYLHKWYTDNKEQFTKKAKEWRAHNKDLIEAAAKRREARNRKIIDDAKDRPCIDCGRKLTKKRMHFDHVRGTKKVNLGRREAKRMSTKAVIEELAKCEFRCFKCHARRHGG